MNETLEPAPPRSFVPGSLSPATPARADADGDGLAATWLRAAPRRRLAAFLIALSLAIGWPGTGPRRPLDAHESFVARTALEMQRGGDFIVPSFNGQVRLQKPPLSYWLTLAAARIQGDTHEHRLSESSARLPSILAGALYVAATAWLGWLLFDSLWIGALGAIFLATSSLYITWSRSAQPEMVYALCCTLMIAGVAWSRRRALEARSTWVPACVVWLAAGTAILAKGPIFPALLLCASAIALRRRAGGPGWLRTLHVASGSIVVLVLVVPYFALVTKRAPEAVQFWYSQMFDRVGGVHQAWWQPFEMYYVVQLLENALPWSVLLLCVPVLLWRRRRAARDPVAGPPSASEPGAIGLLVWCAALPCVVLSFSAGRKGYYLLPITPVVCLLMAWAAREIFTRATASPKTAVLLVRALRVHAVLFLLAAGALIAAVSMRGRSLETPVREQLFPFALLAAAGAFAVWSWRASRHSPVRGLLALLGSASAAAMAIGAAGLDAPLSRTTGGEFAREVGRTIDSTRPLLVLDGDQQVLLHYTDLPVTEVEPAAAALALTSAPAPWIVDRESQWAQRGWSGKIVLRERSGGHTDRYVLVDTKAEPGR